MNGVYFLVIDISSDLNIRIGTLGRIFFGKGTYIYVGSAMNGLENRINRHLRKEKKMHWHIDYLLSSGSAKIISVFAKETSDKKEECATAKNISGVGAPIKNFGCGDCACDTHLFRVSELPDLPEFRPW